MRGESKETPKMRYILSSVVLALVIVAFPMGVFAQQTIFNVPSADVLDAGKVYLETDQYFRPWQTDSDDDLVTLEVGLTVR
jgi:hypothetical protein